MIRQSLNFEYSRSDYNVYFFIPSHLYPFFSPLNQCHGLILKQSANEIREISIKENTKQGAVRSVESQPISQLWNLGQVICHLRFHFPTYKMGTVPHRFDVKISWNWTVSNHLNLKSVGWEISDSSEKPFHVSAEGKAAGLYHFRMGLHGFSCLEKKRNIVGNSS